MARVVALVPDLLFGSRVQAMLVAAGDEVELAASPDAVPAGPFDVLVVDLTDREFDGIAALRSLRTRGLLGHARTLAFYSHVEADTRARAVAAGFELVVPRSRMAREGAQLVAGLVAPPA